MFSSPCSCTELWFHIRLFLNELWYHIRFGLVTRLPLSDIFTWHARIEEDGAVLWTECACSCLLHLQNFGMSGLVGRWGYLLKNSSHTGNQEGSKSKRPKNRNGFGGVNYSVKQEKCATHVSSWGGNNKMFILAHIAIINCCLLSLPLDMFKQGNSCSQRKSKQS